MPVVFALRFYDGIIEMVDEHRGLTREQLAALNQGRARLVAGDGNHEEIVLAERQPSGEVMILAGLPSKKI